MLPAGDVHPRRRRRRRDRRPGGRRQGAAPRSPTARPSCCKALHRTWPPLVDFGARLADELGHPVQINAYITPPQSRASRRTTTSTTSSCSRSSGRKRWTLHPPVVTDPLDNQPSDTTAPRSPTRAPSEPLIDTVLEPGDALYLPRGTIHSAEALGETSIHLTVGVHPMTRYQLVRHLLELGPGRRRSCARRCRWASTSPTRRCSRPQLAATVAALQERAGRVPAARIAAAGVGTDLMQRTRPEPIGPLAQLRRRRRARRRHRAAAARRAAAAGSIDAEAVAARAARPDDRRSRPSPPTPSRPCSPARHSRRPSCPASSRRAADARAPPPARGCPGAGVTGEALRDSRRTCAATRCSAPRSRPPGCCSSSNPSRGAIGRAADVAFGPTRPRWRSRPGQGRRHPRAGDPRHRDAARAHRRWAFVNTRAESRRCAGAPSLTTASCSSCRWTAQRASRTRPPLPRLHTRQARPLLCPARPAGDRGAGGPPSRPGLAGQPRRRCRFAATVLVLPLGLMYGRVPPTATPEFMTAPRRMR